QARIAEAQKGLGGAQDRVSALTAKREKLGQSEAVKAYKDVTAAIREKEGALSDMQIAFTRAGGSMEKVKAIDLKTASAKEVFKDKLEQLGKMGSFAKASIAIALVAAFVAVTAAIGNAAYSLIAWVTELGDAARTARIFADATARSSSGG